MIRALFVALAISAVHAVSEARVQMEPGVDVFTSKNWIQEKGATSRDTISATFVLKHDANKVKKFDSLLMDISNPMSGNYGKWLSQEKAIDLLAPTEEKLQVVLDFLAAQGISNENIKVGKFRDIVQVQLPGNVAETMFDTQFVRYRSIFERQVSIFRIATPYSLPASVADVVSVVDDIMRFPSVSRPIQSYGAEEPSTKSDDPFAACGSKCNGYTTPEVLEEAYQFSKLTSFTKGNGVSVAEFQTQYWDQPDLTAFSDNCDVTVEVDTTIGGNKEKICELGGCVEALLDIEYIGAISNPIPLTVWFSKTYSLFDWVDSITTMENPPWVHSVSYGNDEVQQTSNEYMQACNDQFMKAAAMGLSLLFASGDQGVWGRTGVAKVFHPDFPAGSPYITSVGGTNFQEKSVVGPESAWNCGGGGFSDTFARPAWQDDAVSAYLTKAAASGQIPDSSFYNATGRGYPDVSALGGQTNPYCVAVRGGSFSGVAGTSASCPVVAGLFAQLNDIKLAKGDAPLGFLNPFIYQNAQCFNDVNDGSMNNCNFGTTGFYALDGWDAATGHGTPNFSCLAKLM